jgi:creatinine amidohydrolase
MKERRLRLDEMPWPEVTTAVERGAPALIPIGAIEAHGRHAPLGTDVFIAEELARRLAEKSGAVIFPPLPLGTLEDGYEFGYFPGSVSVKSRILIDVVASVGLELCRNGFRRIVIVNGHGPNGVALSAAAFQIYREGGAQVGVLDWWSAANDTVKEIKGFSYGTHADEIETSIVMASKHGHLVDLHAAVINSTTLDLLDSSEKDLYIRKITFTRKLDERWVGESGNMGDPSKATAEKGQRILDETVEVGLKLLDVLAVQEHVRRKDTGKNS